MESRLAQDVLYKIYDANDGTLGLFKDDILTPVHSATFNALGYNKAQFFAKSLFKGEIVDALNDKLDNYYYEYDLVGDGLGHSRLFARLGTDIGPWTAKDENGNVINISNEAFYKLTGYSASTLHAIGLFFHETSLSRIAN